MRFSIRLPGGTFKVKTQDHLRRREQKRQVPVWKIGSYFIIWWPSSIDDGPSSRRTSSGSDKTG